MIPAKLIPSHLVKAVAGAVLFGCALGSAATAETLPDYPNAGTENPATYVFTAPVSGELFGYFAGSDAGYTSTLGLLVNGASVASGVFSNHSTAVGASDDFGHVDAGDTIVFSITNISGTFYSDKSLNADSFQHVYQQTLLGIQMFQLGLMWDSRTLTAVATATTTI